MPGEDLAATRLVDGSSSSSSSEAGASALLADAPGVLGQAWHDMCYRRWQLSYELGSGMRTPFAELGLRPALLRLALAKLLQPRLVADAWTGSTDLVPDVVGAVSALLDGLQECWTVAAHRWDHNNGAPGLMIGALRPGVIPLDDVLWAVGCPTEHAACAMFAGTSERPNLLIACGTELDAHAPFSWEVTPKRSGFGCVVHWVRWKFTIGSIEGGASAVESGVEALAACLMKGCETIIVNSSRFPQSFIPMDQRCDDWGCVQDYGRYRVNTRTTCAVS
jgi:hypothetical protein